MSKALVKTKGTALQPWGDQGEVNALSARLLQMTMPGGNRLNDIEALTLAQIALAHGLNPMNGEIWYLKNRRGEPLGVMVGIKGLRRKAHEQLAIEADGHTANYWPEFTMLTQEEKEMLGIPLRALAYRCELRDTMTTQSYTDQITQLMAAGVPWEAVVQIVGAKPLTEGIGYGLPDKPDPDCFACKGTGKFRRQGDRYDRNCGCFEKSQMTLVQRAMKRAEAEALKRRFDLPFTIHIGGQVETIEGSYTVIEADSFNSVEPDDDMPEGPKSASGQEPFRNVDAAIQWGLQQGVFNHEQHARKSWAKMWRERSSADLTEASSLWREKIAHKLADLEAAQE